MFSIINIKGEQLFYIIIWVGSVFYSLWRFIQSSEDYYYALHQDDFEAGWSFLQRVKDNSDIEWIILTSVFKKFWMLIIIQVFCSWLISKKCIHVLPIFYAFYSLVCLAVIVGRGATFVLFFYVIIMYIVHMSGIKMLCYALNILALFLLHNSYIASLKVIFLHDDTESFLFEVAFAWLVAKCVSFMVDRISCGSNGNRAFLDFVLIISYCFYLPSVFTGPILIYKDFDKQVSRREPPLSFKLIFRRVLHFLYYLLYYFIYEFMLHFVYSSAVQYYPEVTSNFDSWSLCGLGYALPVMFYLKYFILYGVVGSIANLENLDFPPPPKCISCIHLSSVLWRHFDRGLYLWILRYLYTPLVNANWTLFQKFYALALSFAFVCVWHGMDKPVCTWSFLNFCLVASETLMRVVLNTEIGRYYETFSSASKKRLCAFFATPHFIMMCISCTFFLSNWDVGVLLFHRILFSGFVPLIPVFFIMYCGCHVSMAASQLRMRQQLSLKLGQMEEEKKCFMF